MPGRIFDGEQEFEFDPLFSNLVTSFTASMNNGWTAFCADDPAPEISARSENGLDFLWQVWRHEKSPNEKSPDEEIPDKKSPNEESPKEESPKEESPKEESPKEESPNEESPNEESPNKESPNEESTMEESP